MRMAASHVGSVNATDALKISLIPIEAQNVSHRKRALSRHMGKHRDDIDQPYKRDSAEDIDDKIKYDLSDSKHGFHPC